MAINTLTASALQGYNIHLDIGAVGDLLADFTPVYIAANPGQIVYVLENNKCYVINADTAALDYLNIQGTPPITGLVYGNGAAAPTVATPTQVATAASTQPVNKATNLVGGVANRLAVQTAADTTGFVAAPTAASTFLQWNGTALTWAAAGAGTVTSVAASVPAFLSVSGSPITTAGTLAITLSGTALPVLNGGTGTTTSTGSGSTVLSNSPTLVTPNLGTPSAAVLTNATGLPLSTGVVGTLTVPNGGTGVATLTGLAFGNGTSAMTAATGVQVVTAIGSNAVQQATNVAGGAANQIVVQSGAGASSFVVAPTVPFSYLQWTGAVYNWVTAGNFTGATSVSAGANGFVPAPVANEQYKVLTGGGTWKTGGYVAIDTWANIFALSAGTLTLGDCALVTDVGVGGSVMIWDGTNWRFKGGEAVISRLTTAVAITGTTETTLVSIAIPANLAINGSAFDFVFCGSQTNTIAASTSTYRVRIDLTSGAKTGVIPANQVVTNGTTARTALNCRLEGNLVLPTATTVNGVAWQDQDVRNTTLPTGGPTSVAIAPTAAWFLTVSVQQSSATASRNFITGKVVMRR